LDAGVDAAVDAEAGAPDGGIFARRPLREPSNRPMCTRTVRCKPEEDEVPAIPFPEPYARCTTTLSKDDRDTPFSPRETATARANEPTTCCYIEWSNCRHRNVH
jgi:hypothetical protein